MRAKFGPGGNCDDFRLWGGKSTVMAPRFVTEFGLDAYEFEAGRGVGASDETLIRIGEEARAHGVHMSIHAPYFISLSGIDPEKRLKSIEYIRESLYAGHLLGAKTVVVHAGSASKISREEATRLAKDTLYKTLESVERFDINVGIETMGKINQLGTLDEVIEICSIDKRLVPVVDFGHLNARDLGGVYKTAEDYYRVFEKIGERLGDEVAKNLHCHFSKIEWTGGGEKRHLTFEDELYGPDFYPLCETIARHALTPTIICESAGTQSRDALQMKKAYERYIK